MDGGTKFEVAYSDILHNGVPRECNGVIDLKYFAPYAEFRKSAQRCGLEFAWNDDLHYVRNPRWNPIVFANVQEQDLALDCARRLRNETDLELIKRGRVRVEVIEIGSDGDWNGTTWVGQVRPANLDQPDFRLDVSCHVLAYGHLSAREVIRNPLLVRHVAEYLGPEKCFNLPQDGLEHDFTAD